MKVDIDKLRAVLQVLSDEDVAEFEHEADGVRVKIVRGARPTLLATHAPLSGAAPIPSAPHSQAGLETPADSIDVTSPFVGTFYRAPSPDAPAFVDIGSVVKPGQAICIIEAMKLMNEIEAEFSGTIVEIFAQNGKPVEFGQKLFRIKKA